MNIQAEPVPRNPIRIRGIFPLALLTLTLGGCRVLAPVPIPSETQYFSRQLIDNEFPQIEIGRKNRLIDSMGWVLGIPSRITLWDHRVDRHQISEPTMQMMAHYLEVNNLPHVKVRANQYAPLRDFKRLSNNKTMHWFTRYTVGLLSVGQEAMIPGRLFGGDHFNPYTQTIHLYSDIPAIAIHEGGHAKDFTRREYQDLYALAYGLLPLWHETLATEDAFAYLETYGTPRDLMEANRILYPAYGTYVGSAIGAVVPDHSSPFFYGSVIAGHINGRILARKNGGSVGISSPYIVRNEPEPKGEPELAAKPIMLANHDTQLEQEPVVEPVGFTESSKASVRLITSEDSSLGQPSSSPQSGGHRE